MRRRWVFLSWAVLALVAAAPQPTGLSGYVVVADCNAIPTITLTSGPSVGYINQAGQICGATTVKTGTAAPLEIVGNIASGAADSGKPIKIGGVYNSTLPTFTNGQRGDFQIGTRGAQLVQIMAANGITGLDVNSYGDSVPTSTTGIPVYNFNMTYSTAGAWYRSQSALAGFNNTNGRGVPTAAIVAQLNNTSPSTVTEGGFGIGRLTTERSIHVSPRPSIDAGWTKTRLISAATTNATLLKNAPGTIGACHFENPSGAAVYIKTHNLTTAPTVGSSAVYETFLVPQNTARDCILPPGGVSYSTGMSFSITSGAADADTGAVGAGDVIVTFYTF